MATEVINSYNIYVDTERYLNGTSTGDSIMLSLNQTPITCSDNQYIRLTLQSFSMYKSFTNVNPNNNIFRLTTAGGTIPVTTVDKKLFIPSADYASRNTLAKQFATVLSNALSVASGVALAAVPITLTGANALTPPSSGDTDNIITFKINFNAAHNLTKVLVRTLVSDGDSFEILGTNRIRKDDGTPAWDLLNSLTVDFTNANYILVSCPYNCQLSSQQNVYLRTDTNNTNIQTESFAAENKDVVGANNLSNSRILGRMIIDNDFVNFATGTQMEYFVNLNTRQLTFLRLYITDSHGRSIPQNVQRHLADAAGPPVIKGNDPLLPPIEQLTLGNRSWEAAIKVDIVQMMGGQNGVLQSALPVPTVPARFGTEPLNKLKYGSSGYPDPEWNRANNVVGY